MAAIKVENYQNIATKYAEASQQLVGIADYYYLSAVEILEINDFDPELDLLEPFYNAWQSAATSYAYSTPSAINAVSALQEHVIDKARTDAAVDSTGASQRFDSIDEWIDASASNGVGTNIGRDDDINISFTVDQEFADISNLAGYTISAGNIT